MTVAVILDTTALVAYARLDISVGELIFVVEEDGDSVGVPALCVLAAHDELSPDDRYWLDMFLSRTEGPLVLPLPGEDSWAVAASGKRHDVAHAYAEARRYDVPLATFAAKEARREFDFDDVLDLGER